MHVLFDYWNKGCYISNIVWANYKTKIIRTIFNESKYPKSKYPKFHVKICTLNKLLNSSSRKDVFAAAEEVGHVERNDGRRFATVAASEASTTAAKHGHRVAKTMPNLPTEQHKNVIFCADCNF